jgi:hypothetical protein
MGVLQGISEMFPASSLGHWVIAPAIFGWHDLVQAQSSSESGFLAFPVGFTWRPRWHWWCSSDEIGFVSSAAGCAHWAASPAATRRTSGPPKSACVGCWSS